MTEVNFQPVFKYFDGFRTEVSQRFDKIEGRLDNIETSMDKLSGQVLAFQQEMAIMTMRVGRMDSWIQAASQKIGIPYQT